ncbi:RecB family exonuclease [Haloferula sp. A504]|uniref:RecB family exonuclease n=1 Tax=Haloferula sp. A504 TaxID=3373601 RepID=UPI0031CA6F24|nr:PD-(D/E)XK nuclease family protein [Verrucomicrobiaceae bacterium E54]
MIAPTQQAVAPAPRTLPDHISPSAAKSYLSCSLKFFFERVLRLPAPVSPSLHLGKAIHAGLQAFHLARWRGGNDSPEMLASVFEVEFRRLEKEEGPVSWKDDKARTKAREDGLRVLAAYLDSGEAPTERPKAVEVPLDQKLDGLPVPLGGVIDLVTHDGVPVDFKSAAARPDPKQAAFDHEIQLVSYQLLVEGATGETPPSLDLVFLVKTKTPQVIKVSSPPADRQRKDRVVRMLETAVEGIVEERFFPQPGMHCSWCQFRKDCAAWPPSSRTSA